METKEALIWILLFAFAVWTLLRSRESGNPDAFRLERKIDFLLRHFEIDPQEAEAIQLSTEVVSLLRAGKKIAAIKQLRQETRMDLREAKNAVDLFLDQDSNVK